ncbi:MAG: hypothetical protein J6K14_03415 [Clostridia bacterium]|nr:hypothetical protein [Clostridia bacterium]
MVYLRFIIVFSDFLSAVGAELGLAKQSIINLATMRTTATNKLVAHNRAEKNHKRNTCDYNLSGCIVISVKQLSSYNAQRYKEDDCGNNR